MAAFVLYLTTIELKQIYFLVEELMFRNKVLHFLLFLEGFQTLSHI